MNTSSEKDVARRRRFTDLPAILIPVVLCAALPIFGSRPAAAEDAPKIRTVDLQVPANQAWTDTGVQVGPGMVVFIHTTGTIEASGAADKRVFYHNVPAEGRGEYLSNEPQPGIRALAMMGKVGDHAPVGLYVGQQVGKPLEDRRSVRLGGNKGEDDWWKSWGSGELSLGINDDNVADNSGSWTVQLYIMDYRPAGTTGGSGATGGTTPQSPNSIVDFAYVDSNSDLVGENDVKPDGRPDAHFRLTISLAQDQQIASLYVAHVTDKGYDPLDYRWFTDDGYEAGLFPFQDGRPLRQSRLGYMDTYKAGQITFDLYGNGARENYFKTGVYWKAFVNFADKTQISKQIQIP